MKPSSTEKGDVVKRVPKESNRLKVGRATVNWGPRIYGPATIVACAPAEAVDDLVEAVLQARKQISDTAAIRK